MPREGLLEGELIERYVANGVSLVPEIADDVRTDIIIPVDTRHGLGTLLIQKVKKLDHNPGNYMATTARLQLPSKAGIHATAWNDFLIPVEHNRIESEQVLELNPDGNHNGIRSRKLWRRVGAVSVAFGTGIVVVKYLIKGHRSES